MRQTALFALLCLLPIPATATPREGTVEVDGGSLHYQVEGAGPALVLLHDGLVDLRVWDGVWEGLTGEFRVVRYDRRGYGGSPAATEPYVPRDDLRRLMDHLEISAATLVASSAGGDLALRTAFAYPSRVERLVLIGPVVSGLGFSKHFKARNQGMIALQSQEGGLEGVIHGWLADPYLTARASSEARDELGELLRTSGGLTRKGGMERGRRAFGHLGEILVPTLVVMGEEDHPDVHAHGGAIQAGVRGARREVIPGAGHLVALEAPEALLETLLPFLREPPGAASTLDFRIRPCLDLYFHVRSLAAAKEPAEGSPEILRAVGAVREIQEALGTGVLSWEPFDLRAKDCTSAPDLARQLETVPDPLFLFGGREVSLESEVQALGEALVAAEAVFEAQIWPAHERVVRHAVKRLEVELTPRLPAALAYHFRSLGIPDPGAPLPVYFVHSLPWPGAVTHSGDDGAACFLATSSFEPDLLLETVLHEATHGFLVTTEGSGHVAELLRERLTEEGGLSFRDPRVRNIPHTLMFIQSGETVRRILDPNHRHLGDQEGYYDRVPLAREELSIWIDHLDGVLSREQALDRLLALVEEPSEAEER